ncbi:hypothetical protein K0M31_019870 [Melipona bicolor]|uniref:Uncharacterized protein n=1 Tax=Melipona bicolor TaxID=60889 RepID=A0AA40G0C8_9HYME|nr:hypothetical protein K0M31_019870 [Melipona bicolor]
MAGREHAAKRPLTVSVNFSRVARDTGVREGPRETDEPERRDNESWSNEKRVAEQRKKQEEEKRETMGQRQRWKPPLLQSTAAIDSQTDTRFITVAKSRPKLKRAWRIFDYDE